MWRGLLYVTDELAFDEEVECGGFPAFTNGQRRDRRG
jgi:hypothetical protein